MEDNKYLGTGWAFPPAFDKSSGVSMVGQLTDIRQSLHILLSTTCGERIFRPEYGCDLRKWVFAEMSLSEKTLIADSIRKAVKKGEPRIMLHEVDIAVRDSMEGIYRIQLNYTVLQTNAPDNMVFPFYLRDGFTYLQNI